MPESEDDCSNNEDNKSGSNNTLMDDSTGETDNGPSLRLRHKILSDLGEYWDLQNGTITTPAADLVLSMIMDYNNLTASPTMTQYRFKKGLQMFE